MQRSHAGAAAATGHPTGRTLRRDRWWVQPLLTATVLLGFIVYATWAALQGRDYVAGPYISPFYSPCLASVCGTHATAAVAGAWWLWSPALLVLPFPLAFRMSCYYYRRAYYRAFWFSPPACAVAEPHRTNLGESRFPLVLQNLHRYALYFAMVFNVILTADAVEAFHFRSGWGVGVGSLILTTNAGLLWMYSLSCHSCRHLVGGRLTHFSRHPVRYRLWTWVSRLNRYHMQLAWISLIFVALTDLYVRLDASGVLHDFRVH